MRTEPAVLTRLLTHRYAQLKLDKRFGGGGSAKGIVPQTENNES
jgi:hypothetical protein